MIGLLQENFASYMILGMLIGLTFGFMLAKIFFYLKIQKHRKQAVKQSKSVTLGYVNEKIAPLLPNFPYEYKDMTFIGKGVDYIIFDGLAKGQLNNIVFLEIKSGHSRTNKNEKMIESAIRKGNIQYKIMRIKL